MRTEDLDFELPTELIAQSPTPNRSASRLLHYRRADRSITHRTFVDLPQLLRPGDLLVFNDAKVIPARFLLRKSTGGKVEGLFLREISPGRWRALLRNLGNASREPLSFEREPDLHLTVESKLEEGECELRLSRAESAETVLERVGRMPLPPYIKRDKETDKRDDEDRSRYQTVYARQSGSVAAPTAGLHFTDSTLTDLDSLGIERTFVTLHVGMGTFKPVTADKLEAHAMHSERYSISPEAAAAINCAQTEGRRIIAVGTTATRVLESWPADEPFKSATGDTAIFIYPPYKWKRVAAMITNFHLPKSTLVALVAAFVGLDEQRRIYAEAITQRYRFFSYGDAMFVE